LCIIEGGILQAAPSYHPTNNSDRALKETRYQDAQDIICMGVDHWEAQVPLPEFGVGDTNANYPHILSYFKISSTKLLTLHYTHLTALCQGLSG